MTTLITITIAAGLMAIITTDHLVNGNVRKMFRKPRRKTLPIANTLPGYADPPPPPQLHETSETLEPYYDHSKNSWVIVKRLPGTKQFERINGKSYSSIIQCTTAISKMLRKL